MRIAIFHDLMSGGAKRTLMESTRRLAQRHEIDAYTLSCSEHAFADIRPYVRDHHVYPFEALPLLRSPFGRLNQAVRCADLLRLGSLARRIARDIDAGGYDVVFVHPCQFEQGSSVLRHLRTPSVYYCQEPRRVLYETMPARPYDDAVSARRRLLNRLDPLPAAYQGLLRRTDRENTRRASCVLVNSGFMAQTVSRIYGVTPHVSYHGVDVEQFQPAGRARENFVLSVGSLTPLKGFDFLVHGMAAYSGPDRPALLIASNFQNPPERAYLEALARDLGVELILRGNVSDGELVDLYNRARCVVYSPIREPFGLVPLESMACATPVVTVAEGGTSESVVDGHTGRLVPREARAFAAALRETIGDPQRARVLGENGRAHVLARWTWDRAVATLEGHLQRAARREAGEAAPGPALAP